MTLRRDVRARARRVRLLVLDVDGVLTDGCMLLNEHGDELKSFHTHDGMGVAVARRAGIKVAIVTGEKSLIGQRRGAKLGSESDQQRDQQRGLHSDRLLSPGHAGCAGSDFCLDGWRQAVSHCSRRSR